MVFTVSCNRLDLSQPNRWAVYRNSDYRFEFPYPNSWVRVAPPVNRDGQAFTAPDNSDVEIRGWASQIALDQNADPTPPQPTPSIARNFTTSQGLTGQLQVEIGSTVSFMELTLTQDHIVYSWHGRSPSEQFPKYYSLFNYIASQYRIQLQSN